MRLTIPIIFVVALGALITWAWGRQQHSASREEADKSFCQLSYSLLSKNPVARATFSFDQVSQKRSAEQGSYLKIDNIAIPIPDRAVNEFRTLGDEGVKKPELLGFFEGRRLVFVTQRGLDLGNLITGISRYAASNVRLASQDKERIGPASPDFWLKVAERHHLTASHLMRAIETANLRDIDCSSTSVENWVSIFALFAKSLLIPGPADGGELKGLQAIKTPHLFIWRETYTSTSGEAVTYIITDAERLTLFVTSYYAGSTGFKDRLPATWSSVKHEPGARWQAVLLPFLMSGSANDWVELNSALKGGGLKDVTDRVRS